MRIEYMALLTLLSMVLFVLLSVLSLHVFYPHSYCKWIITVLQLIYSWAKLFTYAFFLERLFLVSIPEKSIHFKSYQITISRIIIILWAIFLSVIFALYGDGYYDNHLAFCAPNPHPLIMIAVSVGDLIVSITISVLVTRCLFRIFVEIKQERANKSVNHISESETEAKHMLVKKFMVLSLNALISTQLSLLLAAMLGLGVMFGSLDSLINAWCILLTFKSHNKIYETLCGKMHKCIGYKCVGCWSCFCCCGMKLLNTTNATMKRHNVASKTGENETDIQVALNVEAASNSNALLGKTDTLSVKENKEMSSLQFTDTTNTTNNYTNSAAVDLPHLQRDVTKYDPHPSESLPLKRWLT